MLALTLARAAHVHADAGVASLLEQARNPEDLRHLAELLEGRVPVTVLDAASTPAWKTVRSCCPRPRPAAALDWLPRVVAPSVLERDLAPAHQAATVADEFGFLGFGRKKRRLRVIAEHFGADWRGPEADAKNLVAIIEALIEAKALRSRSPRAWKHSRESSCRQWNPLVDGDIQRVAEQRNMLLHLAGLLPGESGH